MMGQVIGNLLNVILDPIMILVFGWNIAGAAIATVIGNVVGAGYYIVYFLKGTSSLSISLKDFSVKEKVASGVLAIGVPAALWNLLMSLSGILMNSKMAKYGDMAVAGVGVAMPVTMMTGMVCIGLGQGCPDSPLHQLPVWRILCAHQCTASTRCGNGIPDRQHLPSGADLHSGMFILGALSRNRTDLGAACGGFY